jgi:hypothetical protein
VARGKIESSRRICGLTGQSKPFFGLFLGSQCLTEFCQTSFQCEKPALELGLGDLPAVRLEFMAEVVDSVADCSDFDCGGFTEDWIWKRGKRMHLGHILVSAVQIFSEILRRIAVVKILPSQNAQKHPTKSRET